MPVSYRINDGLILIYLVGVVTDRDLLGEQQHLFDDPEFEGTMPRLVDARGVTEVQLSATIVRHVAQAARDRGLTRAAIIAGDNDIVFAFMRMYEAYAEAVVEVFRDRQVALEWLDRNVPWTA